MALGVRRLGLVVGMLTAWSAVAAEIEVELPMPGPSAEVGVGTNLGVLNGTSTLGVEVRGQIRIPADEPLYAGLIVGLSQWSPYRWNGGARITDAATHLQLLGSLWWRGETWKGLRPRLGLVAGVAWMSLSGKTRFGENTILPGDTTDVGDENRHLGFVFGIQPGISLPLRESGVEVGVDLRAGIYDLDPYLAPGFHVMAEL